MMREDFSSTMPSSVSLIRDDTRPPSFARILTEVVTSNRCHITHCRLCRSQSCIRRQEQPLHACLSKHGPIPETFACTILLYPFTPTQPSFRTLTSRFQSQHSCRARSRRRRCQHLDTSQVALFSAVSLHHTKTV